MRYTRTKCGSLHASKMTRDKNESNSIPKQKYVLITYVNVGKSKLTRHTLVYRLNFLRNSKVKRVYTGVI